MWTQTYLMIDKSGKKLPITRDKEAIIIIALAIVCLLIFIFIIGL
jgi:hypothetical protein